MIIPTAFDIIRAAEETLANVVMPGLSSQNERSAATTIQHLLRFAAHRLEHEGQILLDERRLVRELLERVSGYFETSVFDPSGTAQLANEMRQTLAREHKPDVYLTLALLAQEVNELRGHVGSALALLLAHETELDAQGPALIHEIRQYLKLQIMEEGKLVDSAFRGRGPRR